MATPVTSPELVCPAGTPAALRTAVDAGADAVYCGFRNATNARNFPGLNFSAEELQQGVAYAHDRGARVLLAVNTFPPAGKTDLWRQAIEDGVRLGVDAFIVADLSVADYVREHHPGERLHLSVQAGAPSVEAIRYYCEEFGVRRVVLPRILTIAEIEALHAEINCEIECFVFGNHGLMAEGRCALTNYATGRSTNMDGVCSPANQVHYEQDEDGHLQTRLGPFVLERFACGGHAGYPTICKGRFQATCRPEPYYAFEEPVSLNLARLLPELVRAGVTALKIEGRQRSRAYVRSVVSGWRRAVDAIRAGAEIDLENLVHLSEGHKQTGGAYESRRWR